MHTVEGSRCWHRDLGSTTYTGQLHWVPGYWLWPGPVPLAAAIWRMNQGIEDVSLPLFPLSTLTLSLSSYGIASKAATFGAGIPYWLKSQFESQLFHFRFQSSSSQLPADLSKKAVEGGPSACHLHPHERPGWSSWTCQTPATVVATGEWTNSWILSLFFSLSLTLILSLLSKL